MGCRRSQPHPCHQQHCKTQEGGGETQNLTVPPPSRGATWRPRLRRMPSIEVCKEGRIQDESPRHPGAVLRTITRPVHKILKTASSSPNIQNTIYYICRVTINQPGGRRGLGGRAQRTRQKWLYQGHMECRMNPQGGWQLEPNNSWIDNVHYFIRPNVPGRQLP